MIITGQKATRSADDVYDVVAPWLSNSRKSFLVPNGPGFYSTRGA